MSEEEFQGTLERGDGLDQPISVGRKAVKWPDKARLPKKIHVEQVGVDSLECQPTSSRVKVEDLITDEVEEQQSTWLMESMVSKPPVRLRMENTGEAHLRVLREQFKPVVQLHQKRMDKGKVKTQGLSDDDILQLRQAWQQEFADIINGTKEELPLGGK
ncbi:hypothetical protein C0995_001465 [Termitomyces sp. Mi166|nr:hypothetical protein C0995_001465 [Termitomyces sp. Mi166\